MINHNHLIQGMRRYRIPVLVLAAFIAGFGLRGIKHEPDQKPSPARPELSGREAVREWTCAMHPQIRLPKPGKCPICGMDLIPVTGESADDVLLPRELRLSPSAAVLAEVQVAPVERKSVEREIRLVGKVEYDETRLKKIASWVPGRIDQVYVDFTGTVVRKGEPLVSLYSPELITAQEGLIQALRAKKELVDSPLVSMRETAISTVESSREKLRLLGLTPEQITNIENGGAPTDHVTVHSPLGGVVIEKNTFEGMYAETGEKLYSIADLSSVWVKLDVYESDIQWIRLGQAVEISCEAYPGERFPGRVSFIDPMLDAMTRTVKVRVNVPNATGKLKPDMFVHSVVHSLFGETAYAAGHIEGDGHPLVIPASAPLITGKRAVVYVKVRDKQATYEGREVVLGPRTGDYYPVESGLMEGEQVVVNGAFKIDSALQIQAKPSMMNPEGGFAPIGHDHSGQAQRPAQRKVQASYAAAHSCGGTHNQDVHADHGVPEKTGNPAMTPSTTYDIPADFREQLERADLSYFDIQYALSHDSLEKAHAGAGQFLAALKHIDMSLLDHDAHMAWMKALPDLKKHAVAIEGAKDIAVARTAFSPLSKTLISVTRMFGRSGKPTIYLFHCPMANNNTGADWLQNKAEPENPYLGSSMVTCGTMVEQFPPQSN